ncbi:hypothetical protein [Phyllobacterium ifriqiyense]|uniref:hypothetical protein n=1 Tax=Phyllobacterium ifriqiyense TaxID=314238 RepID=UPI00339189B3
MAGWVGISPGKPALPRNPTDGPPMLEAVVAKKRGGRPLSVPTISVIQDDLSSRVRIAPLAERAGGIALIPAVSSSTLCLTRRSMRTNGRRKPWPFRSP